MPIPTDTFWNVRRLNWVFAGSGLVLLAIMGWATIQDYDKHWRGHQQDARTWETALTDAELARLRTPEQQAQIKELDALIAQKQKEVDAKQKEIEPIREQIRNLESQIATIQFEQNIIKADVAVNENHLEHAITAGDQEGQDRLRRALEAPRREVAEKAKRIEELTNELRDRKDVLAARTEERDALESQKKKLLTDQDTLVKKRNTLDPGGIAMLSNLARATPLLQFVNPVDRVQQQVVPDVLTDLGGFMKVTTIDRCMTCHVNIEDKNFTEANVLAFLEGQAALARGLNLPAAPSGRPADAVATHDHPGAAAMPEFWHAWAARVAPDAVRANAARITAVEATVGKPGVEVLYGGRRAEDAYADQPTDAAASAANARKRDAIFPELLKAWSMYGGANATDKNARVVSTGPQAEVRITPAAVDPKLADAAKAAALKYAEEARAAVESSLGKDELRTLRDRYRHALLRVVNAYRDERGEPALHPGREMLAHPDLGLYVGLDSPHPFEAAEGKLGVGCTSCHDGSGQETTFVLSAHTPRAAWVDARTGELVLPGQLTETPEGAHGHGPTMASMLETAFPEGSLVPQSSSLHLTLGHEGKSEAQPAHGTHGAEQGYQNAGRGKTASAEHGGGGGHSAGHVPPDAGPVAYVDPVTGRTGRAVPQIAYWGDKYALEAGTGFETLHHRWDWPMRPAEYMQANCVRCHTEVNDIAKEAPVLAEGRALFSDMGCVNCHQMDSIAPSEKRQVGPDLRHITGKVSPAFINTWVWAPKAFRPSTRMPHFFMLENNSGDEEIRRTRQEALAITEYLTQTARPKDPKHKLPEGIKGNLDNGRLVFNTVGCLGCHTNLNDPGRSAPKAEEWITTDLIKNGELARLLEPEVNREVSERLTQGMAATVEGDLLKKVTRQVTDAVTKELTPKAAADAPKPTAEQQAELKKQIAAEVQKRVPAAMGEAKQKELPGLLAKAKEALPRVIEKQQTAELNKRVQARAKELYDSMTYNERQLYILEHFEPPAGVLREIPRYNDAPDEVRRTPKPVFVHHGPELSGIGTKLLAGGRTEDQARAWLFDWLKEPRNHSEYTLMPNLRLDDQQAADLAEYLLQQKRTVLDPKDKWEAKLAEADPEKLRELTALFLRSRYTAGTAYAKADDDVELTKLASDALLTEFTDKAAAEQKAGALSKDQRRLVFLGKKLIAHYGCMACHQIPGDDTMTSGCPNLSDWGQKGLDKLDFAYLDHPKVAELPPDAQHARIPMVNGLSAEAALLAHTLPAPATQPTGGHGISAPVSVAWPHLEHLRESWLTQKLHNTRIYDRGKALLDPKPAAARDSNDAPLAVDWGRPYDKLKMPTFYLNDRQVGALVTFVISNRDRLVSDRMVAKSTDDPARRVAHGRYLAQKFNCVGCHRIEDNAPPVQQYFPPTELAVKAPPPLWGEGSRVYSSWLFNFLQNVYPIRPALQPGSATAGPQGGIRMPTFPLTAEERAALAAYFVAAADAEAQQLKRHVTAVDTWVADAKRRAEEERKAKAIRQQLAGGGKLDPAANVQLAAANGAGAGLAAAGAGGANGGAGAPDNVGAASAGLEWFKQPSLAASRDFLVQWALDNNQFNYRALDPQLTQGEELATNYQQLLFKAQFLAGLYEAPPAAPYLLSDSSAPQISEERFKQGERLFYDMQCLTCHVLGDPKAPGALPNPTAPNFSQVFGRIQRRWARHWVQETTTMQPGTAMPPFFTGLPVLSIDGQSWPRAQQVGDPLQQAWITQHVEKTYGPTADGQADLVLDFIFAAGARGYTAVQPPPGQFGPPPVPADFKLPEPETKPVVADAQPGATDAAAPVMPAGAPSVTGRIVFQGEPPPAAQLPMGGAKECAAQHAGPVMDPSVIVNPNGTLRNVVVYVSANAPTGRPPQAAPPVLDQKGCLYEPRVVAGMVGQKLVVKNADPFLHNVHGLPVDNPPFNFAQPNQDRQGKAVDLKVREQFSVKCDVHPWMLAQVFVLEHPFFAVTGDQGTFEIRGLPPGNYTLTAWHERFGEQQTDVTVPEGKPAELNFTFNAAGAGAAADAGRRVLTMPAPEVRLSQLFLPALNFNLLLAPPAPRLEAGETCCGQCGG